MADPTTNDAPAGSSAAATETAIISTPSVPAAGGETASGQVSTPSAPEAPITPAPGNDSIIGADTTVGEASTPGNDTVAGGETTPSSDALTPDSYTFDFPDTVTVDPTVLSEVKTIAAEAKLDPSSLGKIMALLPKVLETQVAAVQKANQDAFNSTQVAWRKEVEALPEFSGTRKDQSMATIGRALDQFGNDEVRQVLTSTGAGNNPAVVKFVLKMAQALNEGNSTPPGRPPGSGGRRSYAEKAYPNQPS